MKRQSLSFRQSIGDWLDAPSSVRFISALIFLQVVHVVCLPLFAFVYPWSTTWHEIWNDRGIAPVSLSQLMIVVLGAWTLLLIVDCCFIYYCPRERFGFTRAGLFALLAVFFAVCAANIYRAAARTSDRGQSELLPESIESWPADEVFLQVAEHQAEAVMIVELSIPGVVAEGQHKFPLQRNPRGTLDLGTYSGFAAHGRTKDGRSMGYGGSFRISGQPNQVVVDLSLSWTAEDGSRGDLDDQIQVPWLGRVRKSLGHGATAKVYFQPPAGGAKE
jgi:hypothetical protein